MELTDALRRAAFGAALVAVTLTLTAWAGPATHLPCPRRGAEVLASNKLVRVYAYPSTKERYPRPRRSEACLVGRGTRMTLFDPESDEGRHPRFSVVALSGTLVAYSISHHGTDSGGSRLLLANVKARRILRELPGEGFVDAGFAGGTYRTDLVLDPSGSAALIEERVGPVSERTDSFVVRAAPLGGEELLLDEGPDIEPHSLRLRSGTLSWQNAGVTRTARLTP